MPYIINNTDSSLTVTVPDGVVDTTSYSLALVGRNVSNYGQYFAQNTIRLMENFASSTPPTVTTPLIGQLWYDKSEKLFRVYDGSIWKRATNITVGNDSQKPTSNFGDGGAAFFNTTVDKLQVHDSNGWKDASYAGQVTSAYSADSVDGSPTAFGSRIRNIFLTDTTGRKHPVLAISYVKTTSASGQNAGTTSVDGQSETIMALHSDSEFTLSSSVAPIVDGVAVAAIYTELTSADGIAAVRPGRAAGVIKKGMNVRYEYEQAVIVNAKEVYATTAIGSSSNRVPNIYAGNVDSLGTITASASEVDTLDANTVNIAVLLDVASDAAIDGDLVVGGNLSATTGNVTFTDLTVSTFTRLSGNTEINGNLTVNGVLTQSLGTSSERIEDFYGDDATITNASIANLSVSNDADVTGNISALGDIDGSAGTITGLVLTDGTASVTGGSFSGVINITGDTSGTISGFNSIGGTSISDGTLSITGGDITGGGDATFSGTVTATTFDGEATSALYADLAEIYKADDDYAPGTVVKLGGSEEITQTTEPGDMDVFGVISTDPAYLMNSKADGLPVALTGRVPVRVVGPVHKGERLVASEIPGVAISIGDWPYDARRIIGRSLQDKTNADIDLIEVVVGVK